MSFRSLLSTPRSTVRRAHARFAVAFLFAAMPRAAQTPTPRPVVRGDTSCAACRDFYTWANRAWLDTASIPAASGEWGTWSANDARVARQLRMTLDAAVAAPRSTATPADRTLGTFYASCMDSTRANADGVSPIAAALAAIDSIRTPSALARELAHLHRNGVPALFSFSSEVDRVGDLRYGGTLETTRLALGTRGYASADPAGRRRVARYREHVARTLMLAGESRPTAEHDAAVVIAIDSSLAAATPAQDEDMSIGDMFRHASLERLERDAPGFAWADYLRARGAPPMQSLIVQAPAYFAGLSRIVSQRPMADWRAYLRWRLLATSSPYLSDAFVREDFDYSRESSGATELAPRWERCAREAGADLPEVLGRAYVARTFPPSSKARVDSMVTQIRAVLLDRIATVPWLTEGTRQKALAKARRFGVKIGYPDKWHDVSALRIAPGAFFTERSAAQRFENDRMVSRIGRMPDRAEWDYHSYYHFIPQSPTAWANWDEIIFPAAYLQPPLYDSTASVADNYGAMGVIIGHEMTHLFTADGGDVDADGRVRHWWTPADSARFAVIQQRMIRQFDAYTVLDSVTHVSGERTLSENLADLGGIELAYAAMERTLARQPRRRAAAGDTTPEMRFFLSYARARASKSRPEHLRQTLKSDWHAPSMYRTNGPLSDFDGFARTFGCKPGDPMMRPDSVRVRIW